MPADEVTHGTDVDNTSRGRTGPRHAAPRKPLFTRFHVPTGKAIALAAMPTAVLMGMGFTPTLANADDQPLSNSQAAEEYKDCVAAMEDDASAPASPSATPTESSTDEDSDEATPTPTPSASADDSAPADPSSPDSGSDDEAEPTPAPTPSASKTTSNGGGSDTATPTPSASPTEESPGLLETIGDAITDVFTGGDSSTDTASTTTESTDTAEAAESATPTPAAAPTPAAGAADKDTAGTTAAKDTTPKVTDALKDATGTAAKATEETAEAAEDAADDATASPSASASASPSPTTDPDDCLAATDDEGGVDNTIPLPDDPWTLEASSLLLKGADYQGIVKVRTASGKVKKVLKYVISDGTEIGDLHQLVKDDLAGKTYHAEAAKGSKSTIDDGKTIMYTERISGNLFGLIPITFDPEHPPPLNIPLIYFTNVKVIQAGQFGGTLTVPGLHQYTT
ncbi:hypothetical protein ACH4TV_08120 [Streptomyces sp. NPDC020898]|uniref:hypothetical protein n=1 Tax=Streptomyces sp. NPDC020898 TaxID=3365101 RepID=UPI00379E2199